MKKIIKKPQRRSHKSKKWEGKKAHRDEDVAIWIIMDNLNSHYASVLSTDYDQMIGEV